MRPRVDMVATYRFDISYPGYPTREVVYPTERKIKVRRGAGVSIKKKMPSGKIRDASGIEQGKLKGKMQGQEGEKERLV